MPKPSVVIELSPSRLEVAAVRQRRILDRRVSRYLLPAWSENWRSSLEGLRPRLMDMVRGLGAHGAHATLLYAGPAAATGVFSCPRSAGRAQAGRAARLALGEAAGFPLQAHPNALDVRWTDRANGPQAQNHVLGVADRDESAETLADWLRGAGLVPRCLLPIDAAAAIAAVERAFAGPAEGVRVVLHAGEHFSVLAAVSAGRLRFVRQIALGAETLVSALACGVPGATGEEPYPAASSDLLYRIGIPARDQTIDAPGGLDAGAILPALQPTLQRWILEIRQSLRFGLEEAERTGAFLIGIGPASRMPRLLEVIAEQTGLRLESVPESLPSAIEDWITRAAPDLNLLPRSILARQTSRRVTRGIWVGTAAAGVLLAGDAAFTRVELSAHRTSLGRLQERLDQIRPTLELTARLVNTQNALAAARQRLAARLGPSADWDAALSLLATATPGAIKLSDVRLSLAGGRPSCQLIGRAPLSAGEATLKEYLDALRAAPIVSSCRLGATQRSESPTGPVQLFEITLSLVPLPPAGFGSGRLVTSAPSDREAP